MEEVKKLNHQISDPLEVNLYYMPFIKSGGFFIPTPDAFELGDMILLTLKMPSKPEAIDIEGKVVWITPKNALHHVLPGIGIQFTGTNAATNKTLIESQLDASMEVGGYTYGFAGDVSKTQK